MSSHVLTIRAHAMPYLSMRLLQEGFRYAAQSVLERYVLTDNVDQMVIMGVGAKVKEIMEKDQYLFIRGEVRKNGENA